MTQQQIADSATEIEQLRAALGFLYFWVRDLPVKHPMQAAMRDRAKELLGAGTEQCASDD